MKYWHIIGILTSIIIGIVSMSGCTSTGSPTVAQAQDPIIGVWRYSIQNNPLDGEDYDFRYEFKPEGSYQAAFLNPNYREGNSYLGTWKFTGNNSYNLSTRGSPDDIWIYVPSSDSFYLADAPHLLFTRYQGSINIDSSSSTKTRSSTRMSDSLKFSGYGDDTQGFFVTGGGGFIITGSYSGKSNFIVKILDSNGEWEELVFNKIGSYYGTRIVNLPLGKHYLEVQSSGPWTIDMSAT